MSEDHTLSLATAAKQLGISARTARRWIREGKLKAELARGPYGPEYRVPADEITTAQQVKDVVVFKRESEPLALARAFDASLSNLLDTLRAEVRETVATHGQATVDRLDEINTGLKNSRPP